MLEINSHGHFDISTFYTYAEEFKSETCHLFSPSRNLWLHHARAAAATPAAAAAAAAALLGRHLRQEVHPQLDRSAVERAEVSSPHTNLKFKSYTAVYGKFERVRHFYAG